MNKTALCNSGIRASKDKRGVDNPGRLELVMRGCAWAGLSPSSYDNKGEIN
jgi:hypothetical protein